MSIKSDVRSAYHGIVKFDNIEELYLPVFNDWNSNGQHSGSVIESCAKLKRILMPAENVMLYTQNGAWAFSRLPALEELIIPNTLGWRDYLNTSLLYACPNIRKIILGYNSITTGDYGSNWQTCDILWGDLQFAGAANCKCDNLIHLELAANGRLFDQVLNLMNTKPYMAIREDTTSSDYIDLREDERFANNLENFLWNFKNYIVDRLANMTGKSAQYCVLSDPIFSLIWDSDGNPIDKDICREIDNILESKNWTVMKV